MPRTEVEVSPPVNNIPYRPFSRDSIRFIKKTKIIYAFFVIHFLFAGRLEANSNIDGCIQEFNGKKVSIKTKGETFGILNKDINFDFTGLVKDKYFSYEDTNWSNETFYIQLTLDGTARLPVSPRSGWYFKSCKNKADLRKYRDALADKEDTKALRILNCSLALMAKVQLETVESHYNRQDSKYKASRQRPACAKDFPPVLSIDVGSEIRGRRGTSGEIKYDIHFSEVSAKNPGFKYVVNNRVTNFYSLEFPASFSGEPKGDLPNKSVCFDNHYPCVDDYCKKFEEFEKARGQIINATGTQLAVRERAAFCSQWYFAFITYQAAISNFSPRNPTEESRILRDASQ